MIYLASNYSNHPDGLDAAYDMVVAEAVRLAAVGVPLISPIVHWHPVAKAHGLPTQAAFWEAQNKPLAFACCAMVELRGPSWRHSKGLRAERQWFRNWRRTILLFEPGDEDMPAVARDYWLNWMMMVGGR
ncbi:MAG: DUF1937 family protein [Azospirillum sp.]|nr:DUF1937 family protein [Azospirillum sp.]